MKKHWLERRPELFDDVARTIEQEHPDLRVVVEDGTVFVKGTYQLMSHSEVLDRYRIEVEFPADYNQSLPLVFEVGGRIPRTADRHVIPSSGRACLLVEEDWLVTVGTSYTFKQFLDGPVRNYFLGQSLAEAGQPWPYGERSHGAAGLIEVLAEWFGTSDPDAIRRHLVLFTKDQIKGHWSCPCGSGKPIRKCHVDDIRTLQKRLTPSIAKQYAVRLVAALEAERRAQGGTGRK